MKKQNQGENILIGGAQWIAAPEGYGDVCPVFEKKIVLQKPLKKASLWITALGLYEAAIDGVRVGSFVFAPGWTSYRTRLQYQVYDVTAQIAKDATLRVTLGKGWCCGKLTWDKRPNIWADQPALLAAVELTYQDGSREVIGSGDTWTVAKSPILMSELYDGETYDARIRPSGFVPARVIQHGKEMLLKQEGPEVREIQELCPLEVIHTPKGETVLDFGQNLTGYCKFTVEGSAGDLVELSHAEILDRDGNFYTENMRSAENKIRYYCGGGREVYHPHFSFQGFRYVRVDAYPGEVRLENFRAVVVHSDLRRTGYFESSNPLLNRLFENIIWGQKGNFLDVPTDCPQRDERLGWTGDAQVFARAASYNFDVDLFFRKWLSDLAADQRADGGVPHVIPDMIGEHSSMGWGDAAVICPWQMYLTYGDTEILRRQFESMQKWVDFIRAEADGYLWKTTGRYAYGDWLALDAEEGSYHGATDDYLVATAYFAYSTSLLIKAGRVLGRDMAEYEALYQKIVEAFQKTFISGGRMTCNTQTAHVLPLQFGLARKEDEPKLAENLARLIHENGDHLTTGFLGTPYLLHVLADHGYGELAVTLLLQEDYPSWLYEVKQGATTIWEHWDGIKPDGSLWSPDMNSYNHYAYGAVADFLYGRLCGISPDETEPGFARIHFRPLTDRRLSSVRARIDTRCGRVEAGWERRPDGGYTYTATIPEGCSADVVWNGETRELSAGTHVLEG